MPPSHLIQLSPRARTILAGVARGSASGREVRRAQALLWLDSGESIQDVAQRLHVSRQMLYDLIARYEARSEWSIVDRIQDEPHVGRPATKRQVVQDALEALLTASHVGRPATKRQVVQDALEALLTASPEAFGYRGQLWTIGMLKTQIELQYELSLSDDTVQRAVHELDFRYKRPRYVLARRDPFWQQAKGGSKTA